MQYLKINKINTCKQCLTLTKAYMYLMLLCVALSMQTMLNKQSNIKLYNAKAYKSNAKQNITHLQTMLKTCKGLNILLCSALSVAYMLTISKALIYTYKSTHTITQSKALKQGNIKQCKGL